MDTEHAAAQREKGADETGCGPEGAEDGAKFGAFVKVVGCLEMGDGGPDVAVREGLLAADGAEFGGFAGGGGGEELALRGVWGPEDRGVAQDFEVALGHPGRVGGEAGAVLAIVDEDVAMVADAEASGGEAEPAVEVFA